MRNMAKIAIINLKGGVGKSVTACNLSCILAGIHSRRVLVMDLDKQAINQIAHLDIPAFRNEDGSVMRINNSVRVKEAKSAHEPLYKFAPKCKPAEQYKNLAVRVMQIVEGK